MLSIKNLSAGYGRLQVLYDINLDVQRRSISVIVGPNGSGKSTLLKTIFGLTTIFSGEIKYNGYELNGLPPHKIAEKGVAYLPQTNNVFNTLKVRENLLMAGYRCGEELKDRVEESLNFFPVLKTYLDRKASTLSGGEKQMLAMAMALIRNPQIMLFDEPTANLSPKISAEVLDKIVELRENRDMTIILVEQNAKKALELGEQAYLLVSGRVAFKGSSQELLSHPELGKLYLGLK
ncbi:MAG: ABC transporter ATP-binding protein [Nitrososphaerales archaeon]